MPEVFVSYSRRDKEFVKRLRDALTERRYDVWVDWEDIPPSAQWMSEIYSAVGAADAFIYVISPDSVSSEVCHRELDYAAEQHKRVVPVVCREPQDSTVPDTAAELNWIFLRPDDDFGPGIDLLVQALEQDLEHVRTHTRLGVAANRWMQSGQERSQLLRGAELAAAEAWLVAAADKHPAPTQLQRQYVLDSRQAATRRQRVTIGAVSAALLITIVLAVLALIQRSTAIHERNVALARQLDADAQNEYAKDPELSVLLAVQAAHTDPGSATEEALRAALAQSHVRTRYTLASVEAGDALWSPDGTRLLVSSPGVDGWARIYSPGTGAAPVSLGQAPGAPGQSAWDARGDRVLIGGADPAVYDALTGKLVTRLSGDAQYAALSGDGDRAVTVDVHAVGHVFDVATGRQLATFDPAYHGGTTCMALSPDGDTVAQCDLKSLNNPNTPAALDSWDTRTGALLHSIASPAVIGTVAFSPDSRRYVFTTPGKSGGRSGLTALAQEQALPGTFVYDARSGARVISFPGGASAATFSPVAAVPEVAYATLSGDVVHVYSFLTGVDRVLNGSTDVVDSLAFSHGGTEIVAATRDGSARIFDVLGSEPPEVLAGHAGPITSAAFGLADTALATASRDGTVRLWSAPKPRPSAILPVSELPAGGSAALAALAFTPDGSRLISVSTRGQGLVLDAGSLRQLGRFAAPPNQGFAGAVVSQDGTLIVAVSGPLGPKALPQAPVQAEAYSAVSGAPLATFRPTAGGPLLRVVVDRAAEKLAILDADGSVDVYAARSGRLLRHLPGSAPAATLALSRDGSQLAVLHTPPLPARIGYRTTLGAVTVDLWNVSSGQRERTITGDTLTPETAGSSTFAPLSTTFSPDGRLLAVSGVDQGVEVYSASTGSLQARLGLTGAAGGSFVKSLAFSPTGTLLGAGAVSGAFLWRVPGFVPAGAVQHVPPGNAPPYLINGQGVAVAFSSDSSYLATSGELTLNAWDVASRLQLFHAYPIYLGTFSPSAQELATADTAGIEVYPCELCGNLTQLLRVAKRNTTRGLTPTERTTYLQQG